MSNYNEPEFDALLSEIAAARRVLGIIKVIRSKNIPNNITLEEYENRYRNLSEAMYVYEKIKNGILNK